MSTELASTEVSHIAPVALTMATVEGFRGLQRAGKMLASSALLPERWRGTDEIAIANCAILIEMATRIGANPIAVAQNLYLVHGTPGWSAQFLIAAANSSGRFSSIRFEFRGAEGSDDWACRAWAKDLRDGERLNGAWVSIGDAKRAGWYARKDSKWQSMPEQMLSYRAGAYWVRRYCPEITMGMHSREEVQDGAFERDEASEPRSQLQAPVALPEPARGRVAHQTSQPQAATVQTRARVEHDAIDEMEGAP